MKQYFGHLILFAMILFGLSPVMSSDAESFETLWAKQNLDMVDDSKKANKVPEKGSTGLRVLAETSTLSGLVEMDYEYIDVSDTADENSGSTSDLYLSSVELALRVFFNKWAEAKIVAIAEDVGRDGSNEDISIDEAIFTLKFPRAPLYLIGGKTVLPFGVFEDHMISGSIVEDIYEIDDVGVTLGFAPDLYDLNITVTVYEGQDIIDNLEDFGTHEFRPGREKDDDVNSFIAAITVEPIAEMLSVAAFYNNEPGEDHRNRSVGGAITLNAWKLVFDAEYIAALEREKGADGRKNKENAWFVALAFQPTEKLELAARYEAFNDDRSGDQDEIPDERYLAGFNYSFFDFATFSFEYRYSRLEKEKGSTAADSQNEFRCQLALEF